MAYYRHKAQGRAEGIPGDIGNETTINSRLDSDHENVSSMHHTQPLPIQPPRSGLKVADLLFNDSFLPPSRLENMKSYDFHQDEPDPPLIPHIDQIHTFRGPPPVLNTKYDPILERKPHNPFQGMKPVPPKFDPFHISSSFNPPTASKHCQPKYLVQSEPVENSHAVVQRVKKQSARMDKSIAIVCGAVIFVVGAIFGILIYQAMLQSTIKDLEFHIVEFQKYAEELKKALGELKKSLGEYQDVFG
ncbi:hypothetical protein MMC14_010029 [Varicellaria rhodocarpa]|nr:hypothetical protein [Varicellaria rhodocarpa]